MDEISVRQSNCISSTLKPARFICLGVMLSPLPRSFCWGLWTGLSLLLVSGMPAAAQPVLPPPGFVPGEADDATFVPSSDRYTGSGSDSQIFDSTSSQGYPRRNLILSGDGRIAAERGTRVLIEDDEPPLPRVWFRPEALIWWSQSSPLPVPIVTNGSPDDAIPGGLGQPGTSVLIGDQNIRLPVRGGGRFTLGFSFDAEQTWGIEGTYFSLADSRLSQGVFSNGGTGSPWLAVPYYNPLTRGEDATPIALPGEFAGQAVVSLRNFLQGTEINVLHNVLNSAGVRLDLLGGFRYMNLQENLLFATESPNVYPNPPAFFDTFDQFKASNNFYGGQFGLRASYDWARLFMNATGKLAIGSTFETVDVSGGTFTNVGGYASAPGAYLTQPTNIGSWTSSQFAVVPELDLNVGVRLAPWASFIVGYSFLYLSSVARPGEQIDRVINPSQSSAISTNFPASLTGPSRPDMVIHHTDFWAQGLNFALEFRF